MQHLLGKVCLRLSSVQPRLSALQERGRETHPSVVRRAMGRSSCLIQRQCYCRVNQFCDHSRKPENSLGDERRRDYRAIKSLHSNQGSPVETLELETKTSAYLEFSYQVISTLTVMRCRYGLLTKIACCLSTKSDTFRVRSGNSASILDSMFQRMRCSGSAHSTKDSTSSRVDIFAPG